MTSQIIGNERRKMWDLYDPDEGFIETINTTWSEAVNENPDLMVFENDGKDWGHQFVKE